MMELPVFNLAGARVEALSLNDQVWSGRPNRRLLVQAVAMYRSNARVGTASTKTRGQISGGGKKPWKQKHTGRARAGSIRSPLWRHGGVIFGPHPRDFGYELPKAIRRKALLESLKGKLQDKEVIVVSALAATEPKTKPFASLAKTFEITRPSVIVLEAFHEPLVKSLRNLALFTLRRANDLNAFDVLNTQKVLVTKAAWQHLEERVARGVNGYAPAQ